MDCFIRTLAYFLQQQQGPCQPWPVWRVASLASLAYFLQRQQEPCQAPWPGCFKLELSKLQKFKIEIFKLGGMPPGVGRWGASLSESTDPPIFSEIFENRILKTGKPNFAPFYYFFLKKKFSPQQPGEAQQESCQLFLPARIVPAPPPSKNRAPTKGARLVALGEVLCWAKYSAPIPPIPPTPTPMAGRPLLQMLSKMIEEKGGDEYILDQVAANVPVREIIMEFTNPETGRPLTHPMLYYWRDAGGEKRKKAWKEAREIAAHGLIEDAQRDLDELDASTVMTPADVQLLREKNSFRQYLAERYNRREYGRQDPNAAPQQVNVSFSTQFLAGLRQYGNAAAIEGAAPTAIGAGTAEDEEIIIEADAIEFDGIDDLVGED